MIGSAEVISCGCKKNSYDSGKSSDTSIQFTACRVNVVVNAVPRMGDDASSPGGAIHCRVPALGGALTFSDTSTVETTLLSAEEQYSDNWKVNDARIPLNEYFGKTNDTRRAYNSVSTAAMSDSGHSSVVIDAVNAAKAKDSPVSDVADHTTFTDSPSSATDDAAIKTVAGTINASLVLIRSGTEAVKATWPPSMTDDAAADVDVDVDVANRRRDEEDDKNDNAVERCNDSVIEAKRDVSVRSWTVSCNAYVTLEDKLAIAKVQRLRF